MMGAKIVAFGELLLRLAAPGRELLLQRPRLDVHVGGAEANVAVQLAQLGHHAAIVSVVPDSALGRAAINEMRRYGVDVRVRTGAGRMGLYFMQPGAIHRPGDIIYDRAASAFACAPSTMIDWEVELDGAAWLHVSGITATVGPNAAAAALRAVAAARSRGVKVSADCNYRAKMWAAWDGDAPAILSELLAHADLMFGDHRDVAMILRQPVTDAAAAAFAAFPSLQRIAATTRDSISVDHHEIGATLITRDRAWELPKRAVAPIVDRIGGGDAFAAGVLHGLVTGAGDELALGYGLAATCLKHAQIGDAGLASADELVAFVAGAGLDVRR